MVPRPEDVVWRMRNFMSRRSLAANKIFDLAAPPVGGNPEQILRNIEQSIPRLDEAVRGEAQDLLQDLKDLVSSLM